MQKLIKKVIAGAIAALMITSSMPFVAMAAPGDYTPDVQLQFSALFDGENGAFGVKEAGGSGSASGYKNAVLAAAPMAYDEATGTLSVLKDDMNAFYEEWEMEEEADGDWNLTQGDVFAVTIRIDNVTEVAGGNINIRFSDNLTPAGYGVTGSGKRAKSFIGTADEMPDGLDEKASRGFNAPIEEFSARTLYDGVNDAGPEQSKIQDDPNAVEGDGWSDQMMTGTIFVSGDSVDVSSVDSSNGFFDIVNHTLNPDDGYTYPNQFILATFAFEITGEGPIKFALQDPTGEFDPLLDAASFFAKKSEGFATENATTYAINKFNRETGKQDGTTEWPGSAKMTFMGKNTNKGGEDPEPVKYTITFKNADGTDISVTDYEEGEAVEIPDLPANYYDDTKHYSYAWDATPSATATANATYQVVETSAAHVYGEGVVNPTSTCTTAGTITYTCACGKSYTEDAPLADHTPGTAVKENDVPSTCNTLGGYDSVVYCTECNAELSRTHVDYTEYAAHTPGEAVKENDVPSTCTVPGGYDMVVRCTVCGTQIGQPTHYEYQLAAHTPGEAVKENDVPSTCKTLGGYDSVVYCTECGAEISRTHVDYTEYVAHTEGTAVKENEVAATKKDRGSYDMVVYCTECGDELSRETFYTDALGVTVTLEASDIGIVEGLEIGKNKVAYGASFTVTATPVEGATFIGWEIDGKLVSKEATYTYPAVATDLTVTPIFEDETTAANITVTFYDKYGNTVKQYKDVTVEQYQAAIAADYDNIVAPTYPSYTFESWDKSKDEILAIDASTTIWANYVKVAEEDIAKYTVTTSADLILPAGIVNGAIPYDTLVTVRDTDATAWKVGEATVAYGTEYTFYVGADIEVQPVYETVEQKASVTVIGANLVDGNYKYNIVATRNVPEGYTLSDYGFVYGKNLTDAELDLDKVGTNGSNENAGAVKAVRAGTRNSESNEFAFNYGIKAKNAPITAKAFIIVTKDGETEIIYSDMFTQNY